MPRSLGASSGGSLRPLVPGALVVLGSDAGSSEHRHGLRGACAGVAVTDDPRGGIEPALGEQRGEPGTRGHDLVDVDVHRARDVSLARVARIAAAAVVLGGRAYV